MIAVTSEHINYLGRNSELMKKGGAYQIKLQGSLRLPDEESKDKFCKAFTKFIDKYNKLEDMEV